MRRIVILGRGGAGKSTLAVRLGAALALPVIELDKHFWAPDLTPTPKDQWAQIQRQLTSGEQWIIDGDLGPYDVLDVRLRAADTVIMLDFPLWRCAWRALRRSGENLAFWRWLFAYRRRSLPTVMNAIASNADHSELHVLRSPRAVEELLNQANTTARLERLGAKRVWQNSGWWVREDPAGLPFCVVRDPGGGLSDQTAHRWD